MDITGLLLVCFLGLFAIGTGITDWLNNNHRE